MLIVLIGALIAIAVVTAIVLLLRTFYFTRIADGPTLDCTTFCFGPMQRLFNPTELQYLRDHGVSKERIKTLRIERRKIYRLYLQTGVQEFNRVHQDLKLLLVASYADRRSLATLLARQKFICCLNVLLAEGLLTLHTCGLENIPELNVFRALRLLQAHFGSSARSQQCRPFDRGA